MTDGPWVVLHGNDLGPEDIETMAEMFVGDPCGGESVHCVLEQVGAAFTLADAIERLKGQPERSAE